MTNQFSNPLLNMFTHLTVIRVFTCQVRPGSIFHENDDADLFASWVRFYYLTSIVCKDYKYSLFISILCVLCVGSTAYMNCLALQLHICYEVKLLF